MLPVMDGVSVLVRARQEHNTTPVLLLTAKSEIDDKITGKADYIIRLTSTAPDFPEAAGSRYFIVGYFPADNSFSVDCTHTTLIKEKSAVKYARMVLDGGSGKGFVDIYRYNIQREKDSVHMVFLSRSAPLEAVHSNTETLIIISVSGVLVMAVFLIIVSGRVVQPIVKNREKQKEFITSSATRKPVPGATPATTAIRRTGLPDSGRIWTGSGRWSRRKNRSSSQQKPRLELVRLREILQCP